jgi:hypothetical protein
LPAFFFGIRADHPATSPTPFGKGAIQRTKSLSRSGTNSLFMSLSLITHYELPLWSLNSASTVSLSLLFFCS